LPEAQGTLLDTETVEFLEGMMPKYSEVDRTQIDQAMISKRLFPLVEDDQARNRLRAVAETCGRVISIHTMIEDLTFLAPCTAALRHLHPKETRRTTAEVLLAGYRVDSPERQLQVAEGVFKSYAASPREKEVALVQLWLYTWRHFVQPFTNETVNKRKKKIKWLFDTQKLKKLADLARQIGFHSEQIDRLAESNPAVTYSKELLQLYLGQDIALEDDQQLREARDMFTRGMRLLFSVPGHRTTGRAVFTTNEPQKATERRFNSPTVENYLQSRPYLFVHHLCGTVQPAALYPTPLAVSREILFAFFDQSMLLDLASRSESQASNHSAEVAVVDNATNDGAVGHSDPINVPASYSPPPDGSLVVYSHSTADAGGSGHVEPTEPDHNKNLEFEPIDDVEPIEPDRNKRQKQLEFERIDDEVMLQESRLVDEGLLLEFEPHPSGSPRRDENLAPGFEDDIVGAMETFLPIQTSGRTSALDVIKKWDNSRNEGLVVLHFVREWAYMKLFRRDYLALRSNLMAFMHDGYKMITYKDEEFRLLEDPIQSGLEWQLILCAKDLDMGNGFSDKLSQIVKTTGKRDRGATVAGKRDRDATVTRAGRESTESL
jgi:hypothetical protein